MYRRFRQGDDASPRKRPGVPLGDPRRPHAEACGRVILGGTQMRCMTKWLGHPSWIFALIITGLVAWVQQVGTTGEPPPDAEVPGVTTAGVRAVSADGCFRVFQSRQALTRGDGNDRLDGFVENVRTGAIWLVSNDPAGGPGNGDSAEASISADGRYVAFRSIADNLVAADTNRDVDIFVKDLVTGATT